MNNSTFVSPGTFTQELDNTLTLSGCTAVGDIMTVDFEDYSHAEGYKTQASGNYSSSEGCSLLTSGQVGNIGLGSLSQDYFIPVRDETLCGSTETQKVSSVMNFGDSAASYIKDENRSFSMSASEIDY